MTPKQTYYTNLANTVIKGLNRRGFNTVYAATKEEALKAALEMLPSKATVSSGGSQTLNEIGLMKAFETADVTFLDRTKAVTEEEKEIHYSKVQNCDYFFMSSNAITVDGQLVNVDGTGNRLSFLIFGPKHVVVIAGINKVVTDVEAGLERIKLIASPPNTVRLNRKTPCAVTGVCGDCLSPDCICTNAVITRRNNANRVTVILVGEDLGF